MNLQCDLSVEPLRVLIVNSMSRAAKFLAIKILSGEVFGKNQLIDITLMVYSNEQVRVTGLKCELEKCAFACTNSIKVSANLPSVSDADVFCFITNFANPNATNFADLNTKQLDVLDLIINIANNLHGPVIDAHTDDMGPNAKKPKKRDNVPEKKGHKPIFVADGLIALHILLSFSKNVSLDAFFCPTPISAIAKSVLGEHLKVQCKVLNDVLVWAANDKTFHVEFEKPLIIQDKVGKKLPCDWDMMGNEQLASFNLDHTQFNSAWLKKDLIAKTLAIAQKNPYGNIYRADLMAKCLHQIWLSRLMSENYYTNLGVVSDGSLGTIKGYPYVLPIVFSGDTWRINTRFEEDVHRKQEMKKINKAVKDFHSKLIPSCKKLDFECGSSSIFSVEEEEDENQEENGHFPRKLGSRLGGLTD